MKLKVIKEYEIGDLVFINDPKERKRMVDQIHPTSLFGEIVAVNENKSDPDNPQYEIQFLCDDGALYSALVQGDELLEWFDVLYDYGPVTIASKYGQDVSDNFAQRGLFYKALVRSRRHGKNEYEVGDVVFDLDPRAEEWFDAYIGNNRHDNVFGTVDYVGHDSMNSMVLVINYGDEIGYNRYPYQITTIEHFPRKDDPWYNEYKFTRDDNNIMDIYTAGKINEYKQGYADAIAQKIKEMGYREAPMTNTPVLEPEPDTIPPQQPVEEENHLDAPEAPDIPFTYDDPVDDTKYHDNVYCES